MLLAFSPCRVVGIVADEAPFLLHHDDVQSRQPFAEFFQAPRIGKADKSFVEIMWLSSCLSSPQSVNLGIYLIRLSVRKTGQ